MQTIKQSIITIIICVAVVAGVSIVSAWTGPTQTPPDGNTSAPINVSVTSQIKSGPLQVNGFRNLGNSIFDGNVGIGTASPGTNKLQVNGKIQAIGGDICTDQGGGKCLSAAGGSTGYIIYSCPQHIEIDSLGSGVSCMSTCVGNLSKNATCIYNLKNPAYGCDIHRTIIMECTPVGKMMSL